MTDPFSRLGLRVGASADEVRQARRNLARQLHPDAGGDAAAMQAVNVAAAEALRIIAIEPHRDAPVNASVDVPVDTHVDTHFGRNGWVPTTRDVPSFTIEALPAEAFEALLVATGELGEVEDDDPPYVLRTLLGPPLACWCQLDVVPDAGTSTVNVSIAPVDGQPLPQLVEVRNAWIVALNGLDWSAL